MEREQAPAPRRHIAIIGGTFDPIHIGHLVVAEEVRTTLGLAEMIFMPAGQPPHKVKQTSTPAHHRLAMVERAIATNPHFSISRTEVDRQGPSYLVDTLRILHKQWGPAVDISFVIGRDSLAEFHTWYQPAEILAQLAYLIAVRRPGYVEDIAYNKQLEAHLPGISQRLLVIAAPQLEISSTDLRRRCAEGHPITYQVPAAVEDYICEHKLYRTNTEKR